MATFSQWSKHRSVRRVAWVCGPEWVLREEVVRAYREKLRDVLQVTYFEDLHLWDELLSAPPPRGRLSVVRSASITPERMHMLLDDALESAYVVFVSGAEDFYREETAGKKVLAAPLAVLRDSPHGQLIRCCIPAKEEEQYALVAGWWPGAGKNIAAQLLARCSGDLPAVWLACQKAVAARLQPSPALVPALVTEGASGVYADALIACDRKAALAAAEYVEVAPALAKTAYRLSALSLLHEAVRKGVDSGELARSLKLDRYIITLLRPHAARYGPREVARRRELLAMAEAAHQSGAVTGVLEAVAALW